MATELPRATTREHRFFVAICNRLDAQNELLAAIRDRLLAPTKIEVQHPVTGTGPQRVELREPVQPPPAPEPVGDETEPVQEPAAVTAAPRKAAKKAAAKKTTGRARKTATSKETT